MSGHKSFQKLIKDFSSERVKKIDQKKRSMAQVELKVILKIWFRRLTKDLVCTQIIPLS
jgi:hypothetical protein